MRRFFRKRVLAKAQFPLHHPVKWKVFRSILTGVPSIALGLLAWRLTTSSEGTELGLWQKDFKGFLETKWYWVALVLAAPVLVSIFGDLWEGWAKRVKDKQTGELPSIVQTTLLAALDDVVGKKLNRFAEYLRELRDSRRKPQECFAELIHPEEQMEEIVSQIYIAMRTLLENRRLSIVLVECKNNRPERYLAYMPNAARPEPELLAGESFFCSVAESNRPIVIPDIRKHCAKLQKKGGATKHLSQYVHLGKEDPEGSIVGFPLKNNHVNEKTLILTLKSPESDVFNEAFIKKYRSFFESFEKRLQLEGCLLRIKNSMS